MRLYLASRISTAYLCTKNETTAPLHVATLTVNRILPYLDTTIAGMVMLTVERELPKYEM